MTSSNHRHSDHDIDPQFLDRWSPRAFAGTTMSEADLMTLLDAAHWAPSASNVQPWRFVYALRGSESWPVLLDILNESNQVWAKNAAALVILISRTHNISASTGERTHAFTHAFDTGAAWHALALQATLSGFHAHAMAGIDRQKAMSVLEVGDDFRVEAAVAIGRIADKDTLPEALRAREIPSQRKPLSDVAFEGKFRG